MLYFLIGLMVVLQIYQISKSSKAKGTMYLTRRTSEEETMQVGIDIDPDLTSEEIFDNSMRLGTGLEKRLEFHNDRKIKRTEEAHAEYLEKQKLIKEGKVKDIK